MAGMKDVARRAGVAVGTVSRALNNNGYVADKTRKKIEKAMTELNYVPNELGRNLYHSRSGIVAILLPTVAHPFFSEVLSYLEYEFHEAGYKTMVCSTDKEKNYERQYLDMLKRHIVDGVVTGVHSLDVGYYQDIMQPIVAFDRYISDNIPVVAIDHREGGRMAAEELMKAGCRTVVQFKQEKLIEAPAQIRHQEFAQYLSERGVTVYTYELECNRFDMQYLLGICRTAQREHPDADGMFGMDLLALCYLKAVQEAGFRVPDDMKIVAYDGTRIMDAVFPSVTLIRQPFKELASEAARLLIAEIEGKENREDQVKLKAVLVKGRSTEKTI